MTDTTNFKAPHLTEAQGDKFVSHNEGIDLLDAALAEASPFAPDNVQNLDANGVLSGLTFGYLGGRIRNDNVITTVARDTILLTASDTNYVEVDTAGTVTVNQAGFTSGRFPLHEITTDATDMTAITDKRAWFNVSSGGGGVVLDDYKDSVKVATTANITLSGEQTIDGVLTSTSRVLVKNQSTGSENGIYVSAAGAWTRATDFDEDAEVTAMALVPVEEGTANADQIWILATNNPITVGSTALTFSQFAAGGTDADAIHDNVAGEIAALTEKVTPVNADLVIIEDSADSNNKKKVQVGNLPGGGGGISNLVEDTTPQLGGQLDVNGQAIGDGTLELLKFSETASAVNEITVTNAATTGNPKLSATGDDVNIGVEIAAKGTGSVVLTGPVTPSSTVDGRDLATDGSKLDGIEAGADVTDATNVAAAGAVMADGTGDDITGDLVFAEKADHSSTPAAGKGYIWTKNTTPSTLIFTNDAGTDTTLGAGGGDVGKLIQRVDATPYTTYSSHTTVLPYDNTIPQNTEGTEIITVTITPTSATNALVITMQLDTVLMSGAGVAAAALFQDTTAGAIAVAGTLPGAGFSDQLVLSHRMISGTTSSTTYKIRVGPSGGTMYINGDASTGVYGGIAAVRLSVEEIEV